MTGATRARSPPRWSAWAAATSPARCCSGNSRSELFRHLGQPGPDRHGPIGEHFRHHQSQTTQLLGCGAAVAVCDVVADEYRHAALEIPPLHEMLDHPALADAVRPALPGHV